MAKTTGSSSKRKRTASFSVSKSDAPTIIFGQKIDIAISGTVKSISEHPVDWERPNGEKYISIEVDLKSFDATGTIAGQLKEKK